jgi:hypothetical protein
MGLTAFAVVNAKITRVLPTSAVIDVKITMGLTASAVVDVRKNKFKTFMFCALYIKLQ